MNAAPKADNPGPLKPLSVGKLKEQLVKFTDSINHETPLACVLLSTSFLEQCLATLIHDFMVDCDTADQLCSYKGGVAVDLSKKSKLAYCCGLIPKGMLNNLEHIGDVRNRFAHAHFEIDFKDDIVIDLCSQMVSAQPMVTISDVDVPDVIHHDASEQFRYTVTGTALHIIVTASMTKHQNKVDDPWKNPIVVVKSESQD